MGESDRKIGRSNARVESSEQASNDFTELTTSKRIQQFNHPQFVSESSIAVYVTVNQRPIEDSDFGIL